MIFLAFGGEPTRGAQARATTRTAGRKGRRRWCSSSACSPCSPPSPASSSTRPTGRPWTTSSTRWRSRSSTRRTARRRSRASSPSGSAWPASPSPGSCTRRSATHAPRPWAALEEKLYFDRLYDALFYRPSVATAKLLYALVEGPLVGGSLSGIVSGTGRLAGYVRSLQTGIVRTYVLAVAGGLAVLVLVFISVATADGLLGDNRAHRAAGGGRARASGCSRGRASRQGSSRSSSRSPRSACGSRRSPTSTSPGRQHAPVRGAGDVVRRPRRLVPRRLPRHRPLAGRPRGRLPGRGRRLRDARRPRAAARVLRAHAPPHRRHRRRLLRPGSPPLLRLLGGDAHPALPPRRRVGRGGPAARDAALRHLHDGRLAADAGLDHRLRPLEGTFDLLELQQRRRARRGCSSASSWRSP